MKVRLHPSKSEIDLVVEEINDLLINHEKGFIHENFDYSGKGWGDWEERFEQYQKVLFNPDGTINNFKIRNFIALAGSNNSIISTYDRPNFCLKGFFFESEVYYIFHRLLDRIFGRWRAGILEALETHSHLKKQGFKELLNSYPMPSIGNPSMVQAGGLFNPFGVKNGFTNRYIRHIYQLGILDQALSSPLNGLHVDIGSSYGPCASLLKRKYPNTKHLLIDKKVPLILAFFYLRCLFPDAKIFFVKPDTTNSDIQKSVSENDFTLLPADYFVPELEIAPELITNFYSFGEMPKHWLEIYCNSDMMKKTKFLYTVNRYDSRPSYTAEITFMDYPFHIFKPIKVQTCWITKHYFEAKCLFFTKKMRYPSEFFEFIGENKSILT